MQYGFIIGGGDVHTILELAVEAEAAGWDGVFIPDCISIETADVPPSPTYDPWIVLAAIALRTRRVRFGPLLTPPSRRRPWKLARETMTLDHLSQGRLVLSVGLGAAEHDAGFYRVGETMSLKSRAELLDETLDILAGLWSGEPFSYQGKHYQVGRMTCLPSPVQQPRIPIWVVGAWPRQKSMRRVLRWDGIIPQRAGDSTTPLTPDDLRAIVTFIEANRSSNAPFDITQEGETPGNDPVQAAALVRPWQEAGATWWLEARWDASNVEEVRQRIKQGPPRVMA